ncbi:hypothetical protein TB2_006742 [Malus domestica]
MTANEYYRRFTDLSRYHPKVAANPEFYEILLKIEDSEHMPNESEDEEEKNGNQRRDDKGNENDQHHIIVNLFLNPYLNLHGGNDLTKCNGANIISL